MPASPQINGRTHEHKFDLARHEIVSAWDGESQAADYSDHGPRLEVGSCPTKQHAEIRQDRPGTANALTGATVASV
jgi:hypothetical protein